MGNSSKAFMAGGFLCASLSALLFLPTQTLQNLNAIELVRSEQSEALNIIGISCLGAALIGLTFLIRQHQSPQGLNEKP